MERRLADAQLLMGMAPRDGCARTVWAALAHQQRQATSSCAEARDRPFLVLLQYVVYIDGTECCAHKAGFRVCFVEGWAGQPPRLNLFLVISALGCCVANRRLHIYEMTCLLLH